MLKLVASLFLSKSGSDSVRVQVSLFVFAPTITPKIKLIFNFITPSGLNRFKVFFYEKQAPRPLSDLVFFLSGKKLLNNSGMGRPATVALEKN